MKTLLSWLSCSLISLLCVCSFSGCNKNKNDNVLKVMKPGKYEITQYMEYPSGGKDTIKCIGYGPWLNKKYAGHFNVVYDYYQKSRWIIYYDSEIDFTISNPVTYYNYKLNSMDVSNEKLSIDYSPLVYSTDSTSGRVEFQYIEQ